MAEEKVRIDKYLWAIRVFKTRADASEACEKGRVRANGTPVKASKAVAKGQEFEIKAETRKWVILVTGVISNRVQYTEAINFYTDITPEEESDTTKFQGSSFHTGKRNSKIGRPTKKERRDLGDIINE